MREALFVLIIIAVLLGLTAIRYRKQILGLIGFARTLKEIRQGGFAPKTSESGPDKRAALVNCAKCGIWIPDDRAIRSQNRYYCSDACVRSRVPS